MEQTIARNGELVVTVIALIIALAGAIAHSHEPFERAISSSAP